MKTIIIIMARYYMDNLTNHMTILLDYSQTQFFSLKVLKQIDFLKNKLFIFSMCKSTLRNVPPPSTQNKQLRKTRVTKHFGCHNRNLKPRS